jgi:hypothetical protein
MKYIEGVANTCEMLFLTLYYCAHLDRLHCHKDRSVVAANVVCLGLPHLHTVIVFSLCQAIGG